MVFALYLGGVWFQEMGLGMELCVVKYIFSNVQFVTWKNSSGVIHLNNQINFPKLNDESSFISFPFFFFMFCSIYPFDCWKNSNGVIYLNS